MANLSTKTGLPSFSQDPTTIVNYFADPGFERATNGVIPQGYALYNDGAVAIPVNGAGAGATTGVTFLASNAAAIRGTMSAVLSKDANNRRGIGVVYPFTISQVDKGQTAGVDIEMVTSAAYPSGGLLFYIYDVTNSTLITPTLQALPKLDNYGKFFSNYGLTQGTSYRFIFHIADNLTNAWTVKFDTMINTTTRVAVPGAVISNEQPFVASVAAVTMSPQSFTYTRSGTKMKVLGNWTVSANTGSPARLSLPDNKILSTPGNVATVLGYWTATTNNTASTRKRGTIFGTGGNNYVSFGSDDYTTGASPTTEINGNALIGVAGTGSIDFECEILDWSGQGTVNTLNQNTQSPIRAGTITPFAGATIPTGWLWCDGTDYAIAQYPQLSAQLGTTWNTAISPINGLAWGAPAAGRFRVPDLRNAFIRGDSNAPNAAGVTTTLAGYQADINKSHTHAFNQTGVLNLGTPAQGGTFATGSAGRSDTSIIADGGVEARPQNQGIKYIIKAWDESFNLAGFANATAGSNGLVAPRRGQYDLTPVGRVTSGMAGWTTTRGVAIYYQDQDGNHRLKFNLVGFITSVASFTSGVATIAGVTFKNISGYLQPLSGMTGGTTPGNVSQCFAETNTGNVRIGTSTGTGITALYWSGDVELDSKPTWA